MLPDDSKQALIRDLTNTKSKREEQGCLAKVETIRFLKEKALPGLHAYAVRYTSTTQQQWDEVRCFIQNAPEAGEVCHTSTTQQQWDGANLITHVTHATMRLQQTLFGGRGKTENRGVTTEEERIEHGSQPWIKLSAMEGSGHWLLYGTLIANGHDVASVRMIPPSGQVEEDEIHDGFVFFLSQGSPPIAFELYSPSHTLVGKQLWEFDPL